MVICPNCASQQSDQAAFCEECGARLEKGASPAPAQPGSPSPADGALICSDCGIQLEPGSNFCDMCGAPVSQAPPAPPSPAPAPVPTPPPVYSPGVIAQGCLVVQDTNVALPFPLGKAEIVIGREDPVGGIFPEIDLTDHGGDEGGVSRQHARIFLQSTQVSIEDLNSTNYTYVNQQKLTPEQPHPLNDGDEICLGRLKLDFHVQCIKAEREGTNPASNIG